MNQNVYNASNVDRFKIALDISKTSSVTLFKTKLKTYLFKDAFDLEFLSIGTCFIVELWCSF